MVHREATMSLSSFRRAATLVACPAIAWAQAADPPVVVAHHTLERVDVTGSRPSTLPIEIPTSTESIGPCIPFGLPRPISSQ